MKIKLTDQDKRNVKLIIAANKHGGHAPPGTEDTPERVIANRLDYAMQQRVAQAAWHCGLNAIRAAGLREDEVSVESIRRVGCKALSEIFGETVQVGEFDDIAGKGWATVGEESEQRLGQRPITDDDIPF